MTPSVLIVGNDHLACLEMQLILEKSGYKVARISRGKDVLKATTKYLADVIIMDLPTIGDIGGWEAALELRQNKLRTPIIFLSNESGDPFDIDNSKFLPQTVSIHSIIECINKFDRLGN